MRRRAGILQANNASGVAGLRARWRVNRYGRRVIEIDVSWVTRSGERRTTSYPATTEPLRATARAIARREREARVRVRVQLTPRQVWLRLRRMAGSEPW